MKEKMQCRIRNERNKSRRIKNSARVKKIKTVITSYRHECLSFYQIIKYHLKNNSLKIKVTKEKSRSNSCSSRIKSTSNINNTFA